jgi:hypothetical protein
MRRLGAGHDYRSRLFDVKPARENASARARLSLIQLVELDERDALRVIFAAGIRAKACQFSFSCIMTSHPVTRFRFSDLRFSGHQSPHPYE